MYRKFLYLLFMVFSFLLLQDCGDFKNNSDKVNSAVEIADRQSNTSAPTVSSTYPSDSASSVAPNTSLTVTFSEAMDTTTI
ncbi:MAG TPA: Ig-like domain-containing protein, partial [Candidatus Marinimicrobia bacterium]|nr:Ig-like domain-containing protein [Candidatus Neomarinimicrobiota bacterium]